MSSRSVAFDNSGALLTASSVAVYTVPAGYKATVQKLLCYNTDATTGYTLTLHVALDGAAVATANLIYTRTIGSQQTDLAPLVGLSGLPAGAKIYAKGDTTTKLRLLGSVTETTT